VSEARTFFCSICGDPSTQICVYCTKDACSNHLCGKCLRCSDCCECDVPLEAADQASVDALPLPAAEPVEPVAPVEPEAAVPEPAPGRDAGEAPPPED
jgi:hypothetical protein